MELRYFTCALCAPCVLIFVDVLLAISLRQPTCTFAARTPLSHANTFACVFTLLFVNNSWLRCPLVLGARLFA